MWTIFFFKLIIYLFMAVLGLRFCVRALSSCGKWGHSSSRCAGLSPSRPLPLRSTGSRRAGPAAVSHGPNCSAARGILPGQGSNPYPLHWQADSQPLRHQGSPGPFLKSLLNLLQYCFCFMFWFFGHEACGILAPNQGSNPHSLHWKAKS